MIITADTLITGDGSTVLKGHAVYIQDGTILEVGPLQEVREQHPDALVTDYGDATILPGLVDMHVHLGHTWGYEPDAAFYDDYMIAYHALWNAQRAFTVGVTTVRDAHSEHLLCERLRYMGKKGLFTIPRIFHCDNALSMTNGHIDIINQHLKNQHSHPGQCRPAADGPWEIRKAVREALRSGADWIKAATTHRDAVPEYTAEELEVIVEETHRFKRKCGVHAGIEPGLSMAIEAGFDTIEHGTFLTIDQARVMEANGQVWVPTIIAYTHAYESVKEEYERTGGNISDPVLAAAMERFDYFEQAASAYRDNFKAIYDTGVKIAAGTDVVVHGGPPAPVAKELAYMVRYGITPVEAVRIGTYNGAVVLGAEDEFGLVAEGLCADLLVCEGDASGDITNLQRVREVFSLGKAVYKNEIEVK